MYDAINDSRTRPNHAAMDGHIAHANDPIWKKWYTPAGHNCRCTVISLSEEEARARGYTGQPAPNVSPDQGWAYDRRGNWQEGMQSAIDRRLNQCDIHRFSVFSNVPIWCINEQMRKHLTATETLINEDKDAGLERYLKEGINGQKYQATLARLEKRGLLGGPLTDAEAFSLTTWSGDTNKVQPYRLIGESLRALGQGKPAPHFRDVSALIVGISRALEKLPPANIPLAYRAIKESNLPKEIRTDFMKAHTTVGSKVQYNSFTAFSSSEEMAWEQFGGTDDSWVLIIKKPKQLKSIMDYTVLDASEHLSPMLSQYEIVRVVSTAKRIYIKEIIGDEMENLPKSKNFSVKDKAGVQTSSSLTPEEVAELDEIDEMLDRKKEALRKEQASPDYVPPVLTEEQKRWGEIMQYG